jgi:hypothetical protein
MIADMVYVHSTPIKRQERKVFLVKDQFVKLSAEPHTKDIREHHSHTIAKDSHAVNGFLFIYFTMGESKSRSTLISLYSDIYHIEYGKNIISNSYAIDISLCIDTCHIAYGIVSRHDEIGISHDHRKCDSPQKSPMSLPSHVNQSESLAILAQR